MTLRRFALALGTAAMLAAPGLALASHTEGGWHHEGMEVLHGVNLTDAQKQQVQSIMQAGKGQMASVAEQMHSLHEQLASAMLSGAPLEQLTAIQRQEDTLREQMDAQRLAIEVQIRGILTPDQLTAASAQHAKLAALHQQEHAVMHQDQSQ